MTTAPREIVPPGPEASLPRAVRAALDPADPVRLAFKPSLWFVALRSLDAVGGAVLFVAIMGVVSAYTPVGAWVSWVWASATLVVLARLFWCALEWTCRWYVLTEARAIRVAGVFRRVTSDVRRADIRAIALDEPLLERLLGLGSLGFASAATGGYELAWSTVARPGRLLAIMRADAGEPDPAPPDPDPAEPAPSNPVAANRGPEPIVLGLAGGVGSGKSTVARAFEKRGFLVSDSDRQTQAVLRGEDVKRQLAEWWGAGVIGADGEVDRAAVARIVFADEGERRRLEALIHPRVRETRRALVARAARLGAPGVVVDAPLLFEAGVDADCDAVVFVDTPRQTRLERVRASRGWDEAELDRREKAQMPLERKRQRSDYVVINAGHADEIDHQVERVLEAIRNDRSLSNGR